MHEAAKQLIQVNNRPSPPGNDLSTRDSILVSPLSIGTALLQIRGHKRKIRTALAKLSVFKRSVRIFFTYLTG